MSWFSCRSYESQGAVCLDKTGKVFLCEYQCWRSRELNLGRATLVSPMESPLKSGSVGDAPLVLHQFLTSSATAVPSMVFVATDGTFTDDVPSRFVHLEAYVRFVSLCTNPAHDGAISASSVVPELLATVTMEGFPTVGAKVKNFPAP